MGKISKKTAIKKFLILQIVVALLIVLELWYFKSNYTYIAIFFIELYAFSRLEDRLITLPDSVVKFSEIYENGTDAIATVKSVESIGRVTDTGAYYIFTVALDEPPTTFIIEDEIMDSEMYIRDLPRLPIRYLPGTNDAIIMNEKL